VARHPRYADYLEDPSDQPFGPGWTVMMPREFDGDRDHIIVRAYADKPGPVPDGWEGLWFQPPASTAVESSRNCSKGAVIAWAKSTGVVQILVEDESTREFAALTQ
jgi:hypothetical protein